MATSKRCPVCGSQVRLENLEHHLRSVHPNDKDKISQILSPSDKVRIKTSKASAKSSNGSRGIRRAAIVAVAIASLLAVTFLVMANRPTPRIQANHAYYDLGVVPQIKTSHTFTFSNSGSVELSVKRIWTSCGCTTAKLIVDGLASPEFGMPGHGGYSGPWSAKVRPGETADLVVYYDAPSMPDIFVGERYVFVDSDDPIQPEFKFTIAVQEVP